MRFWLLALTATALAADLYARAGGGGSYRSSSSSSSRSSGSSSSRSSSGSSYKSSSGSSSYRSSSSSSSYRSSASSSSSRSSTGYSGSSYTPPDHSTTTITRVFSYDADITLLANGRLKVIEKITLPVRDKNLKNVYIRQLSEKGSAVRVVPGIEMSLGCTVAHKNSEAIQLKLYKFNVAGQAEFELHYTLDNVILPLSAPQLSFDTGLQAQNASIRFQSAFDTTEIRLTGLASGKEANRVTLWQGAGQSGQYLTTSGLAHAQLEALFSAAAATRLAPLLSKWQVVHADLYADISSDSELTLRHILRTADLAKTRLRFPEDEDVLLARTMNLQPPAAWRKFYDIPYLRPLATETSATFSFFMRPEPELRSPVIIPAGTLADIDPDLSGAFRERPALTVYDNIIITAPYQPELDLVECESNWSYQACRARKQLAFSTEVKDGRIILHLAQPVMRAENAIRLFFKGSIPDAAAWHKRLRYAFFHYHTMGNRPGWILGFYVILTLVCLVLGVIATVMLLGHLKRSRLRKKELQQLAKIEEAALREIRSHDPAFDSEAFRQRGKVIAERIQQGWCAGDIRDCRRFLSQGVYNRFRLQLKIMREMEKRRNVMRDFHIKHFYVIAHNRSGNFDCLTVRMDAVARDIMTGINTAEEKAQAQVAKAGLNEFTEFYSFMRLQDAKSAGYESPDQCSHCGTPFQAEGELNKCKSCGAVSGSGTFDWVLAEITQYSEYKGITTRKNLGDISPDRLEDRASFIFWRQLMARLTGSVGWIARDASESYLSAEIVREGLFDIAVGAADLESFSEAETPARAVVRIKWSAAGKKGAKVRHRESLLTLAAPLETVQKLGFEEHGCTSCGAPLPETDSIGCAYCHSPIQRKNSDWLLESVETTIE